MIVGVVEFTAIALLCNVLCKEGVQDSTCRPIKSLEQHGSSIRGHGKHSVANSRTRATLCRQATSEHPSVRDMKAPLSAGGVCFIQKKIETTTPDRGARGARTSSKIPPRFLHPHPSMQPGYAHRCHAGPKRGRKCYVTRAFSGIPKQRGDKIRSGHLTPAFSGPQKRAEVLRSTCILGDPQTKGDQIRNGCLIRAFSGAQKRAEMQRNPCILGDPQKRVDKIRSQNLR